MQDGDYFFVLNQSGSTVTNVPLTLLGLPANVAALSVIGENRQEVLTAGVIRDDFTPWQLHVYTTSALAGVAVPEPTAAGLITAAGAGWTLTRRRRNHATKQ